MTASLHTLKQKLVDPLQPTARRRGVKSFREHCANGWMIVIVTPNSRVLLDRTVPSRSGHPSTPLNLNLNLNQQHVAPSQFSLLSRNRWTLPPRSYADLSYGPFPFPDFRTYFTSWNSQSDKVAYKIQPAL